MRRRRRPRVVVVVLVAQDAVAAADEERRRREGPRQRAGRPARGPDDDVGRRQVVQEARRGPGLDAADVPGGIVLDHRHVQNLPRLIEGLLERQITADVRTDYPREVVAAHQSALRGRRVPVVLEERFVVLRPPPPVPRSVVVVESSLLLLTTTTTRSNWRSFLFPVRLRRVRQQIFPRGRRRTPSSVVVFAFFRDAAEL
mmetsp:Transcript_29000/g.93509  ORF Transcript_29000/g.93509 Transcript_29000/m.93509 type:complete len:200 (-) Transcript_29000:1523-2122(-)